MSQEGKETGEAGVQLQSLENWRSVHGWERKRPIDLPFGVAWRAINLLSLHSTLSSLYSIWVAIPWAMLGTITPKYNQSTKKELMVASKEMLFFPSMQIRKDYLLLWCSAQCLPKQGSAQCLCPKQQAEHWRLWTPESSLAWKQFNVGWAQVSWWSLDSLNKSQPLAFCVDKCLAAEPWIMHFNQPDH